MTRNELERIIIGMTIRIETEFDHLADAMEIRNRLKLKFIDMCKNELIKLHQETRNGYLNNGIYM